MEATSRAEVAFSLGSFDMEGAAGWWSVLAATGEYAFSPDLSATVSVPFARVDHDGGATAWGLGDIALAGAYRLYASERGAIACFAGLGVELPTGDADSAIGNGHAEVSPFARFSAQPHRRASFVVTVSDRFSLKDHHHHEPQPGERILPYDRSVISPHTDHEIAARLGAGTSHGRGRASLSADVIYSFTEETVFAAGGPQLGFAAGDDTQLTIGLDIPLVGDRFAWRTLAGASVRL